MKPGELFSPNNYFFHKLFYKYITVDIGNEQVSRSVEYQVQSAAKHPGDEPEQKDGEEIDGDKLGKNVDIDKWQEEK